MSAQTPAYTIRSASMGLVGRSINAIRHHHVVIDSPSIKEEITSGEAFLSGVSACGVTLIEGAARDLGIPLQRIEVTIEGYRSEEFVGFDHVDMRFALTGPDQAQADILIGRYKDG